MGEEGFIVLIIVNVRSTKAVILPQQEIYPDRHVIGPPSPQPKVGTNGQKHDFSNLYKELGYDSTHNFDIIARSLYSLGARKAISKITTLIGKP